MQSRFEDVEVSPSFPGEEEKVLEYWEQINAFQKQLEMTKDLPKYTFYDGPPFATGKPHYGHILVGAIKDTVTRYATQNGMHVPRRFGWDCHGLPVEYEIDKKLGVENKADYERIGLKNYNDECRGIVMRYSSEWRDIIGRFGRWIDFDNDYKTMDMSFMESVWHLFKVIYEKGLVYKGSRVMPYSAKCGTVLSNFEAGSNYKDIMDPSIYVTFPLVDDENTKFVAWTTTPWTLPSNLMIAMSPKLDYVSILEEETKTVYIVAESRKKEFMKLAKIKKGKVIDKKKGTEYEGTQYVSLFDYFSQYREKGCFRVMVEDFVSADDGTGIVHCAPGFGEDDYNCCVRRGIIDPGNPPCPVDDNGHLIDPVVEFKGLHFKEADKPIKKELKNRGRIIYESTFEHSYPFCWRSETPLMYRAVSCWFIKVTDVKEKLIENNYKAKWVPESIQKGRFHNWLADARDWCFSRNRLWGNPIPLWVSDDGEEVVCVGSIKELQELSGCGDINDLHRDFIDHITIPSKQGKGDLKRIDEVFDCWFESGSMPFASVHYPFSTPEDKFAEIFPGDFIAEGIDQTRGWFYTLNVISTMVKGVNPYKNLVVNGIVLAEDGQKMSKRLNNYPDPIDMVNNYSADAVKLYLLNSPIVKGESLKFTESGVKNVVKDVFLPWFNAYRFLIENMKRYEEKSQTNFVFDPKLRNEATNLLDRWIIAANQSLLKFFRSELDNYRLYTIIGQLISFLIDLNKWYIKLNRNRMKGANGADEAKMSLNTLFDVLFSTTLMMSCFTPFISEFLYLNMRNGFEDGHELKKESIHFLRIPEYDESLIDDAIVQKVNHMKKVVEMTRAVRDQVNIPIKKPLKTAIFVNSNPDFTETIEIFGDYIKDEINAYELQVETNEDKYVNYSCDYNQRALGSRLKKQFTKKVKDKINSLMSNEIKEYMSANMLLVEGVEIIEGDLIPTKKLKESYQNHDTYTGTTSGEYCVIIDKTSNEEIEMSYHSREFLGRIQKLRKEAGLKLDADIEIFYHAETEFLQKAIDHHLEEIKKTVMKPLIAGKYKPALYPEIANAEITLGKEKGKIWICKPSITFNKEKVSQKYSDNKFTEGIEKLLETLGSDYVKKQTNANGGVFKTKLDGQEFELTFGTDFFLDGFKSYHF